MTDTYPKPYWMVRELVTIGVFAALVKVSSLLVALIGGGMNPLTLILKNLLFTSLLLVLLFKIRKPGTLLLFNAVSIMVSMLLMGGGFFLLPSVILAGFVAEGLILVLGGYGRAWAVMLGVAYFDLISKSLSLDIS